ncbi:unnamed protein product [Lasius platythorax]|uniref:Uncharacterized protein n=1 Tax=Lasius platythorax TaxID=488582 RepID=A0AAV2N5C0_9HYME
MSIIGRFYPSELRPSIIRRDERREMEEGRAKKKVTGGERRTSARIVGDVQGMVENNASGWKDIARGNR